MKIRYFDFGLHKGAELLDMVNFLPQITNEYEIYGFEALPRHYEDYCKRYNDFKNTKTYNVAITDKHKSTCKLFCSTGNDLGHSIHSTKNNVLKDKFFEVPTIKFSEWLKDNNIDLKDSLNIVKINIEGAEWSFFNDVVDSNLNKYIHIYCGAGHDVEKISKFVEDGIVEKYYELLKKNNIVLHRWIALWKPERNVDLHKMIKDKYHLLNNKTSIENNKNNSHIIQGLWIGGQLTKMEQLSIKSFLDNGHEYHLYTYGDVKGIPEGTVIKDGNEILDKSEIYYYKNGSVSAFSNLFRFTLLFKKGGYWADTDLVCVKPFKLEQDYVISSEPLPDYSGYHVTSSLLKMPKNSKEAMEGVVYQRQIKEDILTGKIEWSAGPLCVKKIVEKYKLEKYILPWNSTCNCSYNDVPSIFNPNYKPHNNVISNVSDIPENMICLHLWNEQWRRNGLDKNGIYHPESLFEFLKKKHNL